MRTFDLCTVWLVVSLVIGGWGWFGCQSSDNHREESSLETSADRSLEAHFKDSPSDKTSSDEHTESCRTDNDCERYHRCIDESCHTPPAMSGKATEETPEVHLYGSQNKTEQKATFFIEIADTPAERTRGLMYRPDMAKNWGMLFIYPDEDYRQFWMKNTFIPLDMLFIRDSGEVAHIIHSAEPKTRTPRPSNAEVRYVLELNGGKAKEHGLQKGDWVEFVGLDRHQTEL